MKSPSPPDRASRPLLLPLRDITILALCAALLFAQQVALAGIPNVELVSLLVMLFTLSFRWKVLFIIYVFVLAEGLVYPFGDWWFMYLYIWTVLAGLTWLFRGVRSPLLFAVLSGVFGLLFGTLCSPVYLAYYGPAGMIGKWISGIPLDLVHGVANFIIALALWEPLYKIMERLTRKPQ